MEPYYTIPDFPKMTPDEQSKILFPTWSDGLRQQWIEAKKRAGECKVPIGRHYERIQEEHISLHAYEVRS